VEFCQNLKNPREKKRTGVRYGRKKIDDAVSHVRRSPQLTVMVFAASVACSWSSCALLARSENAVFHMVLMVGEGGTLCDPSDGGGCVSLPSRDRETGLSFESYGAIFIR